MEQAGEPGAQSTTVGEALARARALLGARGSPALDARRLLEHVLGRDAAWLLAHADAPLDDRSASAFAWLVAERALGVPVAYLTGEAWFFGRRFMVTPEVLVPRPESELLVELAVAFARTRPRGESLRVCDVGTGSGVLAVSLACVLPNARVVAIDASAPALAVAERNAREHGVGERIEFLCGDLLGALDARATFACVVANLPYVPSGEVPAAPDPLAFEPRAALDGGPDGLDCYRRLLSRAGAHLAPESLLALEAAPPTIEALADLTRAALPGARVAVRADAGGLARAVEAVATRRDTRSA